MSKAPTDGDVVKRAENFIVSLLPYNLADRLTEATQALAQEFRKERAALLGKILEPDEALLKAIGHSLRWYSSNDDVRKALKSIATHLSEDRSDG